LIQLTNVNVDFQADLTPLFNWNVKQLFLYLTAEYTTPHNEVRSGFAFMTVRYLRISTAVTVEAVY
jgi:hypothetical protein